MSRFIVIHSAAPQMTQDQVIDSARRLVASLPPETEWLNSWWIPGEVQRLFCEWEALDSKALRAALEPVTRLLPIESIHEAQWIDPQWYK
jgi:hypothetical protein